MTDINRMGALIVLILLPIGSLHAEPDFQTACQWWPEMENTVSPVGWRDHNHRFNVVYNGTILALPSPDQLLQRERKQVERIDGVQLDFYPSADGVPPADRDDSYILTGWDGRRVGDQEWDPEHAAPVLRTYWRMTEGPLAGLTLRQSVFAHMSGGEETKTGTEPMFCWIRLEVAERTETATAEECGFLIRIAAPHIRFSMPEADNIRVVPTESVYPSSFFIDPLLSVDFETPVFVIDEAHQARLAIAKRDYGSVRLISPAQDRRDNFIHIKMAARKGERADLLLPMLPLEQDIIAQELDSGLKGALRQADQFWSDAPATAAKLKTPEPQIEAAVHNNIRLTRTISTTVPTTGQRSLLTGSTLYSYVWPTPTAMMMHMILDPWGWHGDVAKYLEPFRAEQGRRRPPGPDFKPHPGYFGAPADLNSGNSWLGDHGAILYTAARHALLTNDRAFIEQWEEPILKACDFIVEGRRLPRTPPSAEGVMPPAEATDISRPIQAFWSDAFSYKALATAARLLEREGHPRAAELQREADEYRTAIERALRAKTALMPRWTDRSGRERPLVPMTLTLDTDNGLGTEHPFFLDAGPLCGVWAGVLPADDELMLASIDFYRDGPHAQGEDPGFSFGNPPRLIHEISNCEPCYSWNIFHPHRLADRTRYFEGMYSLLAGGMSRQTWVSSETRGGVSDNVFSGALALDLIRLAVVDDEIEPGRLHLARLAPLAWFSESAETVFENMPSEFGPVSVRWKLIKDGKTLRVEYESDFHHAPETVTFHVPPVDGLERVFINGKDVGNTGAIAIE